MITTCWSVKGGSGTTVVAAGVAILATRPKRSFISLGRSRDTEQAQTTLGQRVLLVDLAGDLPSMLGMTCNPNETSLGLVDWLSADEGVRASSMERLVEPVRNNLSLLRLGQLARGVSDRGDSDLGAADLAESDRLIEALDWFNAEFDQVIIDAGSAQPNLALPCIEGADRSVLVVRPCYLSLRQAIESVLPAHTAVVVSTDGRTLDAHDVSAVLGLRDVTTVPFDPEIARLVDSGMFGKRMPRSVERLRQVAA